MEMMVIAIICLFVLGFGIYIVSRGGIAGLSMFSCESKGENYNCQNFPCGECSRETGFSCGENEVCCYNSEGYEDSGDENGDRESNGEGSGSKDDSYATINLYGEEEGIGQIKGSLKVKAEEEKTVYISVTGKGISQKDKGCLVYFYDDVEEKYLRIDNEPAREYFKCSSPSVYSISFTIPNELAEEDISLQIIAYKEDCGKDNICQGVEDWAGSYKVELDVEMLDENPPIITIEGLSDYWKDSKAIYVRCRDEDGSGGVSYCKDAVWYEFVEKIDSCETDKSEYEYYTFAPTYDIISFSYNNVLAINPNTDYKESYICIYMEDMEGNGAIEKFGPLKIAPECVSSCGEGPCFCGPEEPNNLYVMPNKFCCFSEGDYKVYDGETECIDNFPLCTG